MTTTTLDSPITLDEAIARIRLTGRRCSRNYETLTATMIAVELASVDTLIAASELPQSTVYRLLFHLEAAGVVQRIAYRDRSLFAIARPGATIRRFEQCGNCGTVDEVDPNYQPTKAQRHDLVSIIELVTNAAHTCTHTEATYVA